MKNKIVGLAAAFCIVVVTVGFAQYQFFSGDEWMAFSKKSYPAAVKKDIQFLILRTLQEATILMGDPAIPSSQTDLTFYYQFVEQFYGDKINNGIPLYFAVKIAEMQKNNLPPQQIQFYKAAILQRIK